MNDKNWYCGARRIANEINEEVKLKRDATSTLYDKLITMIGLQGEILNKLRDSQMILIDELNKSRDQLENPPPPF